MLNGASCFLYMTGNISNEVQKPSPSHYYATSRLVSENHKMFLLAAVTEI